MIKAVTATQIAIAECRFYKVIKSWQKSIDLKPFYYYFHYYVRNTKEVDKNSLF